MTYRKLRARGMLKAGTALAVSVLASVTAASGAFAATLPGAPLYSESFKGTAATPGDWITGGKGFQPCLTAGNPDAVSSIPACGLRTPDKPGLGFDAYGNFADKRLWGTGTKGLFPNSIVARGAATVNYRYLDGKRASGELGVGVATKRADAKRTVEIRLSNVGVLTVDVNYGKGQVRELNHVQLYLVKGQPKLPKTIKFGFAASTGAYTNIHEITGLRIAVLPPELQTTITPGSRELKAGGTATFTATVGATWMSAPVTGRVTETITFPAGVTPTGGSGVGWTCAVSGQVVNCVTNANRSALQNYPPITIAGKVLVTVPPKVTVTAAARTRGMNVWSGDIATTTVSTSGAKPATIVGPSPARKHVAPRPDLSVTITPDGPFPVPGTGRYLLVVANAPGAGTATGLLREQFTAPRGQLPVSASGPGWTCVISGQTVTCTRPGPLAGGETAPLPEDDVGLSLRVRPGAGGALPAGAQRVTPPYQNGRESQFRGSPPVFFPRANCQLCQHICTYKRSIPRESAGRRCQRWPIAGAPTPAMGHRWRSNHVQAAFESRSIAVRILPETAECSLCKSYVREKLWN
jgi:hypothetical protein